MVDLNEKDKAISTMRIHKIENPVRIYKNMNKVTDEQFMYIQEALSLAHS